MVEISFTGRLWRSGDSTVVTIPSRYITDNHIDPTKKYTIIMQETEEADYAEQPT